MPGQELRCCRRQELRASGNTCDVEATRRQSMRFCNAGFARLSARERVSWALQHLPGRHIVSSSFGAQSAVMLHLVSRACPEIPVVLIDTGYLFAETYRFVDEMRTRLKLNLTVYRPQTSPAWQEARHGQRWLEGRAGIDAYNQENKVEPMKRALRELGVGTWFAGVRRAQSQSRRASAFIDWSGDRFKVHPVADWSDRDIHRYLQRFDLPYHPLWHEGYVSIGDRHTTRSLQDVDSIDETRFFGLKRECGLHDIDLSSV